MRSKNTIYNIATNLLKQFITIIYGFIVPKIIIENFSSNDLPSIKSTKTLSIDFPYGNVPFLKNLNGFV